MLAAIASKFGTKLATDGAGSRARFPGAVSLPPPRLGQGLRPLVLAPEPTVPERGRASYDAKYTLRTGVDDARRSK